jgi:glutamate--cysteine ligase
MDHLTPHVAPRIPDEPPLAREALDLPFRAAEKPANAYCIGVEAEKFGVLLPDYAPLPYEGERSVSALLDRLLTRGFREEREKPGGPVIALVRERTSVTLEPGAQLELSGSPQGDLHGVEREIRHHYAELAELSLPLGIVFCSTGFHPLARREDLPWVPKLRYSIMREYLPRLGDGALDMMQRTATVQANFDYSSERDAMRKLRVLTKLSPIVHAMTANAPLQEGRLVDSDSLRGDVWTRMDPSRSGLLDRLWSARSLSYDDYIEWALDAGMFLFKRHGEVIANTGQTFRDFLRRGYLGFHATLSDWRLHLNTLFPEVRLKNTLEVRACDAQPNETLLSVAALWTGIVYDELALEQAEALVQQFDLEDVKRARPALVRHGYGTQLGPLPLETYAEALITIAQGGLERRARRDESGVDESRYLEPLAALVEQRMTPGQALRQRLSTASTLTPRAIVDATRII